MVIQQKEQAIEELMADLQISEGLKFEGIANIEKELVEVKETNAQLICLYESQIDILKEKINPQNKREEIIVVAQREAVIKQLKKENALFKTKVAKMKTKSQELKV
jgi:hypothetical protein